MHIIRGILQEPRFLYSATMKTKGQQPQICNVSLFGKPFASEPKNMYTGRI